MKKVDLKKLAFMGLTGGLLLGQQGAAQAAVTNSNVQVTPGQTLERNSCGRSCSATLSQRGCGNCGGITAIREKNSCGGCGGFIADRDQFNGASEYQSPERNNADKRNGLNR